MRNAILCVILVKLGVDWVVTSAVYANKDMKCCPQDLLLNVDNLTCVTTNTGEYRNELKLGLGNHSCHYLLLENGLDDLSDGIIRNASFYCHDDIYIAPSHSLGEFGGVFVYCNQDSDKDIAPYDHPIAIRKCCNINETFSLRKGSCVPSASRWKPQIFASEFIKYGRWELPPENLSLEVKDGLLKCNTTILQPGDFYFLDTGQLYVPHVIKEMYIEQPYFCLEDIETVHPVTGTLTLVPSAAVCQKRANTIKKCCNEGEMYSITNKSCVSKPPNVNSTLSLTLESLDLTVQIESPSFCNPIVLGTTDYSRGIHTNFRILEDGAIFLNCLGKEFKPSEFCLEEFLYPSDEVTKLQGFLCFRDEMDKRMLNEPCVNNDSPRACQAKECVPKCCDPGEVIYNDSCVPLNTNLPTNILDSQYKFDYYTSYPYCKDLLKLIPYDPLLNPNGRENITLLANGTLKIVALGDEDTCEGENVAFLPVSQYCLDFDLAETQSGVMYQQIAYTCPPAIHIQNDEYLLVTNSLLVISEVFLFIAFLVYLLVPDLTSTRSLKRGRVRMYKTLFGKIVVMYISNLFFAYLILILLQMLSNGLNSDTCIALGLLMQVSFLGTFFWLNVMCIDLWIVLGGSIQPSKAKRFRLYLLWGLGGPLLIMSITMISEFVPNVVPCRYKPRFARYRCWFSTLESRVTFFMGPISLILIGNVLLFMLTVKRILSIGPKADRESTIEVKERKQRVKQRLLLCLKLSFIMGLAWIFEAIAHFLNSSYSLLIFRFLNSLQGLLVFIIFICKKNILYQIKAWFWESGLGRHFSSRTTDVALNDKPSIKLRFRSRVSNSAVESGSFTFKKPSQENFNGVFDRNTNTFVKTTPALCSEEVVTTDNKEIIPQTDDEYPQIESHSKIEEDAMDKNVTVAIDDRLFLIGDVEVDSARPSAGGVLPTSRITFNDCLDEQIGIDDITPWDKTSAHEHTSYPSSQLDTLDRHNLKSRMLKIGETTITKMGKVSRV